MNKPKVLIVSDSPLLDTGFGRVARELGTGLTAFGYPVTALGWFHQNNDRLVPFRVIPTDLSTPEHAQADVYGQLSYDRVVARVKPDLVITVGDEWMVKHIAARPRQHKLVGYVPIDSIPVSTSWAKTFAKFDKLVAFTQFGKAGLVNAMGAEWADRIDVVPHGVDVDTFRPLPDRRACRGLISDAAGFIVGCVARNNPRKNLPRLLKVFRQFLRPSTTCNACGNVVFAKVDACVQCRSQDVAHFGPKDDAILYLHAVANDVAGHDLHELVYRQGLVGRVGLPDDAMDVGKGVSDTRLNELYNAFDVFALPTMGEGWGLPIAEAMSAGLPVLVTDYSGHVEFVRGAGELINVSDFETCKATLGERAIVDIFDFVVKLDRFYYEPEDFARKYGPFFEKQQGIPKDVIPQIGAGLALREETGRLARQRMAGLSWPYVLLEWHKVIQSLGVWPATDNASPIEIL